MLNGEATNTNVFSLWFDPMAMETQDLKHQRRWKPRIYITRDEHSNHYTTDGEGNPGSTSPETSTLA